MKPRVYIIRGAPASGKGTLASEFAKLLPMPVALIEQDKLRWGFHLIGRTVADITKDEHELANQNTTLLYEQYLKAGKYNIVVEGLFTWDNQDSSEGNVSELIGLAQKYGFGCTSIVLRADKAELLRRNAARKYTVPMNEFNELYNGVYSKIDLSEIVVDSTNQTPEATLGSLKKLIVK